MIFGIPGGAVLPAYDPLMDSDQDPAHPGPPRAGRGPRGHRVRAGHGPGRGLHGHLRPGRDQPGDPDRRRLYGLRARWWRSPARWPPSLIGTDAFQEADICGITMPITKHNFLVTDAEDIPRTIAEAFHIAAPGGPARCSWTSPRTRCRPPPLPLADAARPARLPPGDPPHAKQIREAARMIAGPSARCSTSAAACIKADAAAELLATGRADRRPRGHHADGAGRVPRQPPAAPGHARHARHGRRGRRAAEVRPARHARRPVRRPGNREAGLVRPEAKIVHADIDPAEISKNRRADVPIVGDAAR